MSDFEGLTELYTLRVGDSVHYNGEWHRIARIANSATPQRSIYFVMENGKTFVGDPYARHRVRQPIVEQTS